MLVVRLSHVQHTDILTIDKLMHRLVTLTVDIYSRRLQDVLQCSILDTAPRVITAVTYLQGAIAYVRFLTEEWVWQILVATQFLATLQFK